MLGNQEATLTVPAMGSTNAFSPIELDETNGYLFLCCQANGRTIASNEYALTTTNDVFDWPKSDWTGTPMLKHADLTGIGAQQPAKCKVQVKEARGRQIKLTVSNTSDKVAYMLRIVLKDKKGKIIDGVTFSDNYITIEPKGEKTVNCLLPSEIKFKADVLPY